MRRLEEKHQSTRAREHSYRGILEDLINPLNNGIKTINDGERIAEVGAPDIIIEKHGIPSAFIEAKDIGIDLKGEETTKQMQSYRDALHNLILTNYVDFRWYVEGELQREASLGRLVDRKLQPDDEGVSAVGGILFDFLQAAAPQTGTAEELAKRMAAIAKEMRFLTLATYNAEEEDTDPLHLQLEAFKQALIPDLTPEQFADMYAQTITYGLFAAAVRWHNEGHTSDFEFAKAWDQIPKTNPFLRKLFLELIGAELPDRVRWLVEHLANILNHADLNEILKGFGKRTRQDDPVVHFYEDFLAAYDPALREKRGVYYTPEPVVSYIVRSVDYLLKEKFGRADGLADPNTLVLDPAAGTGTFLYFVIQHIHDFVTNELGMAGAWDDYVSTNILPRIFGFELLMAPYTVAHMKLGLQLQETGYKFQRDQRLGIYLTNTLEEAVKASETLPFAGIISEEGNEAAEIKREKPIMVVLGNPPYSGSSANKGKLIESLMNRYKKAVRDEANIGPLSDDYIKFIRFAHDRIETTGYGVIGFITNHSYISGLVHRGMRQELLNTFDEIYVLDLHGSSITGLTGPNGESDQNVFDIRPGVAITLLVKTGNNNVNGQVFHSELWGRRPDKYQSLTENDLATIYWQEISPSEPYYFFVPQDATLLSEYTQFPKVDVVFPTNQRGVSTRRDHFMVDFDKETLKERLKDLQGSASESEITARYNIRSTKYWSLPEARSLIRQLSDPPELIHSYAYRPFDNRKVIYDPSLIERGDAAYQIMQHMLRDNLALVTFRRIREDIDQQCIVSAGLTDKTILSSRDNATLFPIYVFPDQSKLLEDFDWPAGKDGRRPNLTPAFVEEFAAKLELEFITDGTGDLKKTFGPEDIFHYIYAIFHSPTYRERYAEFLRIDFPRVPLTSDVGLFRTLCKLGSELVSLHLMKNTVNSGVTFPVKGTNKVASRHPNYAPPSEKIESGRVYINPEQYFDGIEPDVWEFHIGGYQVLDKWLKDRKGRTLSYEDIRHYINVVGALRETMRLMDEIDEAIPSWPIE